MAHRAPRFLGEKKIEFVERDYPDPGEGELLLAPRANALCGTDRGFWIHGATHIPGHETAAVVIGAGPGARTAVGTPGVVFLMDYCGACRNCRVGATNQCLAKRRDMGINADGGLGPLEVVHESAFFAVPGDLDLSTATLLLDVMGTSGHAIERGQTVRSDVESLYVAGAGPIGLGLLVMAKILLGHDLPVYVSDLSRWRLDLVTTLGGTPVDASTPVGPGEVPKCDLAFDSTGRESARRGAFDVLSSRGALVCVGHGEGITFDVSRDLIGPERAVFGSEYFRYAHLPRNLELLRANEAYLGSIVTHRVPVEYVADAFELFFGGKSGKVVVEQGV